jgi:hypothetical protein
MPVLVPKLCFATLLKRKQSFQPLRSQAELGNEEHDVRKLAPPK